MMPNYTISEDRLLELLRIELRHKISSVQPGEREADVEYWEKKLLSDSLILSSTMYCDTVCKIPDKSVLLGMVEPAFNKAVTDMELHFENDVFLKQFASMDQQDVYSMFGVSVDDIYGAGHICQLVCHGMYDDGALGVTRGSWGQDVIDQVGDDYDGQNIRESDMQRLIDTRMLASVYYADNKSIIEDQSSTKIGASTVAEYRGSTKYKARMEYHRLNSVYDDMLEGYMDSEGKGRKQAERDAAEVHKAEMISRIESRKKGL